MQDLSWERVVYSIFYQVSTCVYSGSYDEEEVHQGTSSQNRKRQLIESDDEGEVDPPASSETTDVISEDKVTLKLTLHPCSRFFLKQMECGFSNLTKKYSKKAQP